MLVKITIEHPQEGSVITLELSLVPAPSPRFPHNPDMDQGKVSFPDGTSATGVAVEATSLSGVFYGLRTIKNYDYHALILNVEGRLAKQDLTPCAIASSLAVLAATGNQTKQSDEENDGWEITEMVFNGDDPKSSL